MPWYLNIYYLVLALGILVGASRFYKMSAGSRWFYRLLVVTAIVEGLAYYVGHIYHSNLIVYRIFGPIQYTTYVFAYATELNRARNWLTISIVAVWTVYLIDTAINWSSLTITYHTLPRTVSAVLMVFWALFYLRTMLEDRSSSRFEYYPLFWLSIGWLQFSVLTIVNLGALNYIGALGGSYLQLFEYVRTGGNIILYVLFSVAFLTPQHQLKLAPPSS